MNNIINDASVNEWFSQQMASLTPMKMVLALAMGFVVGLIIALVYRKAFRGVLYSPSFATTLIIFRESDAQGVRAALTEIRDSANQIS